MAEENQAQQEPQQVQREPQQVTTKNPKKVEAGKRLAAHNCRRREEQRKEQAKLEKTRVNQYYGIRAVIALGVIGGLGYYIYQTKKGQLSREVKDVSMLYNPPQQPSSRSQSNKLEID